MFALVLFVFAFELTSSLCAQTQVMSQYASSIEKIDSIVVEEFQKDPVGSVTIGVVAGDELIWSKSWGFAEIEKKTRATPETIYRIGSITKQFTGLMLLQLEAKGTVQFDDKVVQYFPSLRKVEDAFGVADSITLLQLATMRSGLAREPDNLPNYLVGPVSDWKDIVISAMPETSFDHNPGKKYFYSNIGYAILGAALDSAADAPFTDYLVQNVFDPLHMNNTSFEPNGRIEKYLAKGYLRDKDGNLDGTMPQKEHAGRGYKVPNGAMYSNVEDLAKFLSFQLGYGPENVLSKSKLEKHFRRVRSENGEIKSRYGIGFFVMPRKGYNAFGHGGAVLGYRAAAFLDRESEFGVIVLRNVLGNSVDLPQICFKSLDILVESSK